MDRAFADPDDIVAVAHALAADGDLLAGRLFLGVVDGDSSDVDAQRAVRIGRLQAQVEAAVAVGHDAQEFPADHHFAAVILSRRFVLVDGWQADRIRVLDTAGSSVTVQVSSDEAPVAPGEITVNVKTVEQVMEGPAEPRPPVDTELF